MEFQVLIGYAQVLLAVILVLVGLNLVLIFRLKDIDPFRNWNPNAVNGALFMMFLIVGLIAAMVSSGAYADQMILTFNAASEHGVEIDRMFWNTMYVSLFVTILTNVLLFYFSWRYRGREGKKAYFYPHNNTLELIWTAVPAVVLTILVFDGVGVWHDIMGRELPKDDPKVMEYEVTGQQFAWTVRYPGADMDFGDVGVRYIDMASSNTLGFNFEDKRGHDDFIAQEIHVPVGYTVNMRIRSQDVLHSATLAHFRVKMDAVPGMPTNFMFKPTITTKEMREKTNNPEFNYEMSCQQICGGGHWNMRRVVVVEEYDEWKVWAEKQRPFYAVWKEMNGTSDMATEEVEAIEPEPNAVAID